MAWLGPLFVVVWGWWGGFLLCCGACGCVLGHSGRFDLVWGCRYSIVAASLFVGLWWWFTAWWLGFVVWLLGCVGVVCEPDSVCLFVFYACFLFLSVFGWDCWLACCGWLFFWALTFCLLESFDPALGPNAGGVLNTCKSNAEDWALLRMSGERAVNE